MNIKKTSKQETEQEIKEIFSNNPTPKQIKKAKNLAMSKNIKLKALRTKFCKNCLTFFTLKNSQIRIKKQNKILLKIIRCNNCHYISRYKLN